MKFYLIAAAEQNMGIGKNGKMPWSLSQDLKYFNKITVGNISQTAGLNAPKTGAQNAVIMGRTTWESLPSAHKPLKNRLNIVLSKNPDFKNPAPGVEVAGDLESALETAQKHGAESIFVIGGAQIYAQAIEYPACAGIYLTEILAEFDCDAFFPKIDATKFKKEFESEVHEENGIQFKFVKYCI